MATPTFGVTAAMVKEIVETTMLDPTIESIATRQESFAKVKTGVTSATGDDLINMQELVILLTAVRVKDIDPHSKGAGSFREEHFPQALWTQRIDELLRMYGPKPHTAISKYQTDEIKDRWGE